MKMTATPYKVRITETSTGDSITRRLYKDGDAHFIKMGGDMMNLKFYHCRANFKVEYFQA